MVIKTVNLDEVADSDCQPNCHHQSGNQWSNYPVTLGNWVAACHEEKEKMGISYAQIARRIGYARPSLSLALSGNYTGKTDTIAAAYVRYRAQVNCPYMRQAVSRQYCCDHALAAAPTQNPAALRHWRACQSCTHKPDEPLSVIK